MSSSLCRTYLFSSIGFFADHYIVSTRETIKSINCATAKLETLSKELKFYNPQANCSKIEKKVTMFQSDIEKKDIEKTIFKIKKIKSEIQIVEKDFSKSVFDTVQLKTETEPVRNMIEKLKNECDDYLKKCEEL